VVKTIEDISKELRAFRKANPSAFFRVGEYDPCRLKLIIEAITDNNSTKKFPVHLASISRCRVSERQHEVVRRYFDAICALNDAKSDLVELFILERN